MKEVENDPAKEEPAKIMHINHDHEIVDKKNEREKENIVLFVGSKEVITTLRNFNHSETFRIFTAKKDKLLNVRKSTHYVAVDPKSFSDLWKCDGRYDDQKIDSK
ncbi:hypothetical protein TNCV_1290251 [Trichonephila clavipes]|nr:hypothetical protein TNCV_1290251 [Trichonephila clavipes]